MAADKTFTSLLGAIELISKINLFYSKTEQQFKTNKGFSRLLFTKWCFVPGCIKSTTRQFICKSTI